MEVRTFTSFWNTERKLYSIYDVALPVPVSLKVVGAFLAAGLPWWGLLLLLQVPFNNPLYLLWLIPPIGMGYAASRPIFQRKSFTEYMKSMFRYFSQPKRLAGLRDVSYTLDKEHRFISKIFTRNKKETQ